TSVDNIAPIETTEPTDDNTSDCETDMQVEVIIGDLNWYEYSEAKTYEEYSNSKTVGKLSIPMTSARCTAFIINSDTIMTNNHCVVNANDANTDKIINRDIQHLLHTYDCSHFIMTSAALDFTLLRCNQNVDEIQGHNILSEAPISVGEELYVIQENCDYV